MTIQELPAQAGDEGPYVEAIPVREIFTDHSYQRDLDEGRLLRDFTPVKPHLLGIIEVSFRPGEGFAAIDGQHRLEAVRRAARSVDPHIVCNVHSGLTVADEAAMFADIDQRRRRLSWWDLWRARRSAGDPIVLAADQLLAKHQLVINPAPKNGNVRAAGAVEKLFVADSRLLDSTLAVLVSAWGHAFDAFKAELLSGIALLLDNYDVGSELDLDRLVVALQDVSSRQLVARAAAMQDAVKGTAPKRVAMVMVQMYNARPGRNVEDFIARLPAHSRQGDARREALRNQKMREWAVIHGLPAGDGRHVVPESTRAAYVAATADEVSAPATVTRPAPAPVAAAAPHIVPVEPDPEPSSDVPTARKVLPAIEDNSLLCSDALCRHPHSLHGDEGCRRNGCGCCEFEPIAGARPALAS